MKSFSRIRMIHKVHMNHEGSIFQILSINALSNIQH